MTSSWYQKKWFAIFIHIAFWTLLFSLPFLLQGPNENRRPEDRWSSGSSAMLFYLVNNATWVGLFYLNAHFFVPKFFNKKKYGGYALVLALSLIILILIGWFNRVMMLPKIPGNWNIHILLTVLIFIFITSASLTYQLIRERSAAERLQKEKENETLKTELSLLRSQVSPHFMFNVLNNMVALARKQSDQLEPSLIKLSSLMRYMLYEADEEKVSLEKEIDYLRSYIDLQQQRFGKQVVVDVIIHPADNQYEIEPMLLIPFVENAFKHGTGMIENARILIELKAEKGILYFTVQNKFNPASEEVRDKTSGIGLTNVKRRLKLLYGKKHELQIGKSEELFTTNLKIEFAS
ncbi:MAG: sensor histidine kinase [Chitinophagaceae bacterium]